MIEAPFRPQFSDSDIHSLRKIVHRWTGATLRASQAALRGVPQAADCTMQVMRLIQHTPGF